MKTGPRPQPTRIKELAGNPGRRPLNKAEPQPPVPEYAPRAPRFLNAEGKRAWRELVKILLRIGLYTEIDKYALALFCQAWGRWVQVEREIAKLPSLLLETQNGYQYQTPLLGIANTAWEQVRKMAGEFGLSPAERSRVRVAATEEEPSLAEMLFQMAGE